MVERDDRVNEHDDGQGDDCVEYSGFDLVVMSLPASRDSHYAGSGAGAGAGAGIGADADTDADTKGEEEGTVVRLTRSILAQAGRTGSSSCSSGGRPVAHVLVLGACAGGATDWVLPTGEAWTLVADVCPERGTDVGARLFRSAESLASAGGGGGGVDERQGLEHWHACRTARITRRRERGQEAQGSGVLAVRELVCRRDGNMYV